MKGEEETSRCHSEKALLRVICLGCNHCLSPQSVTGHLGHLALPAAFSDLKGSHLQANSLRLSRKIIKQNGESWSLKNLGQVLNERSTVTQHQGLEMSTITTEACCSGAPLRMRMELYTRLPKSPLLQSPELHLVSLFLGLSQPGEFPDCLPFSRFFSDHHKTLLNLLIFLNKFFYLSNSACISSH